jgi:hypothetical protein
LMHQAALLGLYFTYIYSYIYCISKWLYLKNIE